MTPEKFKRKLAAILSADVKGYSRLMGEDEEGTIRTLKAYMEVITGSFSSTEDGSSPPGEIASWPSLPVWWMPSGVRWRFRRSSRRGIRS